MPTRVGSITIAARDKHRAKLAICLFRDTKVVTYYIVTQCRDELASISFVLHSLASVAGRLGCNTHFFLCIL